LGTLTVLPPDRHSGDVNRGFALSGSRFANGREIALKTGVLYPKMQKS
jgi:hypothetical protein